MGSCLQLENWVCQDIQLMALRYSPTQWVLPGRVDTYRVVGRTRDEIQHSRVGRRTSREYGRFYKDTEYTASTKPYSRIKQNIKKPTTTTNSNSARNIRNQNFSSRRAMYHRTGPGLNSFTTTSSQYGHY